jgi:NitT/TauT family transport system substrate-binding protein
MSVVVGLWPGSETIVMAHSVGELPQRQINLVEMTWTSAAVRAFQNGVADAAVLSLGEVLHLKESGCDVRVVLVLDSSKGADAVLARPEIRSVADLKGKRIGLTSRASGLYVFAHAIEEAGLHESDFTLAPLNVTEVEEAYKSNNIDAAVVIEPWSTKLKALGAHLLVDSTPYQKDIYRMIAVRSERLADFHQALQTLVNVHFRRLALLRRMGPNDRLLVTSAKREGISVPQLQAIYKLIEQPGREENIALLEPETGGLTQAARRVSKFMLEHGMLDKAIDCSQLTDPTFVRNAP